MHLNNVFVQINQASSSDGPDAQHQTIDIEDVGFKSHNSRGVASFPRPRPGREPRGLSPVMEKGATSSSAPVVTAAMRSSFKEAFWERLSELKIDALHTDERPLPILGYYAPCKNRISEVITLDSKSLSRALEEQAPTLGTARGNRNQCPIPGTLLNTNTLQSFNTLDKDMLLTAEATKIWEDIKSKRVDEEPARLIRFLVISYADLKKWEFHYWVAFPTLMLNSSASLVSLQAASKFFNADEAASMSNACNEWRNSPETTDVPFFFISIKNSRVFLRPLKKIQTFCSQGDEEKLLLGFYDPCHLLKCPGWPFQNLLAFVSLRLKIEKICIFCYRENRRGAVDLELSLVAEAWVPTKNAQSDVDFIPKAVGWEKDDGKLKPRVAKLESSLQFDRQATAAAELNIKLMTWRSMPSLKLSILSSVRCLILGVGSLGCDVARCLMAWGVRKITLVDSRRVSNKDAEQESLFSMYDCDGSENKAVAAARELKRIFSAVEAEGTDLMIPMLGHCGIADDVLKDCDRLQELIKSHDAVFLLSDTRESRWLPSLLCAAENKVVLSAASGVDKFLVMRHGASPLPPRYNCDDMESITSQMDHLWTEDASNNRLACYFCSETSSSFDESVIGPGPVHMASALVVELLVGILHHPKGVCAPGELSKSFLGSSDNPFGILPHQIQGSISQCALVTPISYSSSSCIACSTSAVSEYRSRGMAFVRDALTNNPEYLHDTRKLTKCPSAFASDDLSSLRCLLVGAGTLGCNVARILVARGARKITLIDSGMVSLSNPVRQSLYTLDDCREKGIWKANAAVKKLRSICSDVEAEDVKMAIPMPGHPVSDEEAPSVLNECENLRQLIASHDAVFLLTDTRESRWLPSLLCAIENKIAITAALGFDSFLVMRHGAGPGASDTENEATGSDCHRRLGCYFCNDVVAPADSMSNRTLDQQCTVSRPALSLLSSALAVDILHRILSHPQGLSALPSAGSTESHIDQPLDTVPHQIRGSLPHYTFLTLTGYASSSCTACSGAVVSEYQRRGKEFLKDAINHPTYLEDLTGLTDLMNSASSFQVEWESDGGHDGDDDDGVII